MAASHFYFMLKMVPRPETPEPGDGGGDGAPSLDPSASDILVQPATNPNAATPTRRNRRPRDAGTSSANTTTADPASQSAHLQPVTGAFPAEQDLESKYGPSSASSLRRHVLSPAGGGRVVRRPVVERTLKRLCTLALPPLDGSEDMSSEAVAARSTVDTSHAGNLVGEEAIRTSSRQRTASGMSAGDAAAIASAAASMTPVDESDGRSTSSRMSHATGTTAPVTNTASSVANTTAVASSAHDHSQQLEASFPLARPNFAPGCQPIIVFGRYVAAATDDGRVCLFAVKSFEDNVDIAAQSNGDEGGDWDALERMKERINRIEDERSAVLPVATVGPFRIGGGLMSNVRDTGASAADEFDLPGCIVALAATPAHLPLPTYRRRKKRRRPGDAEDEGDDDPPPPPPKAGHSFLGHIAVLTSEGDFHVLQVYESDNDPKYISRPFVEVLTSFSTMTFCATCICIRKAQGQPENDGTFVPAMRVCVGHDNGIIGEWEIVITCDTPFVSAAGGIRRPTLAAAETKEEPAAPVDAVSAAAGALDKIAIANHHSRRRESDQGGADEGDPNESNDGTADDDVEGKEEVQDTQEQPQPPIPKEPSQRPPLKYSIPRPRLMWAGQLDAPIRSLSTLGGDATTGEDADLVHFQQTHVAIGLAQRAKSPHENPIPSSSTSLPPSLAIEVVNSFQAEVAWQQSRSRKTDMSPHSKGLDPVPLFDVCTWPGIGMEIRDGSMIPDLQSGSGSDYMASRIDDNMVRGACLGLESSSGFAVAVSDGTVVVSDVLKQVNGMPSWGVASNQNQLFLPGPSIGMGCFNHNAEEPTIAYCLQGGLVFAVPAASSESSRSGGFPEIVLYQYPFDLEGDDDKVVRFAHGFVAGDVIVSEIEGGKLQEDLSAVVGFSWAGGIMDIFGCSNM